MRRLKKEELLECVATWYLNTDWSYNGIYPPIPEKQKQAYRQIVAILKKPEVMED